MGSGGFDVPRFVSHIGGAALLGGVLGAAALVATAVTVAACTSLATLEASAGAVPAGQTVRLDGRHFSTDPALSPIEVRDVQARSLLWSGRPDLNGDFTVTIATAGLTPGYHVIVATETDASGRAVSGVPARVVVTVLAPADHQGSASAGAGPARAAAAQARSLPAALVVALAAAAMLVAMSLLWMVLRRRGRRARIAQGAALALWERFIPDADAAAGRDPQAEAGDQDTLVVGARPSRDGR